MKFAALASCLAVAGIVTAPQPARAQDNTAVFKPTGQWSLDYGTDYCRLSRTFSDGKDDLALALERIDPGPTARLILISNGIHPFRSAGEIGWHFTPSDPERKARYTHSTTADRKQYYNLGPFVLTAFAPPAPGSAPVQPAPFDRAKEQTAAKGMTGLVLENGLNNPVQVETGDLSAPMTWLRAGASTPPSSKPRAPRPFPTKAVQAGCRRAPSGSATSASSAAGRTRYG